MITYLIQSAILLTGLYAVFALLLGKETFHHFNRILLLAIILFSLVIPALEIRIEKPWVIREWTERLADVSKQEQSTSASPTEYNGGVDTDRSSSSSSVHSSPVVRQSSTVHFTLSWIHIFAILYFLGIAYRVGVFIWQMVLFVRDLRTGVSIRDQYNNKVIVHSGELVPYSFFGYIVISAYDNEHLRNPILTHEQAHIRMGHSWDILLAETLCAIQWFNPFAWMLARDLRAIHEYEADMEVLDKGIDAITYQQLLVIKALGPRLQRVVNSLNHGSLKNRIIMMNKEKSSRLLMLKGLLLPLFLSVAVVVFAKPKISEVAQSAISSTDTHKSSVTTGQPMVNVSSPMKAGKKLGIVFEICWTKGAWIDVPFGSYIEDRPTPKSTIFFFESKSKMHLNGVEFDRKNVPNLMASELKKLEVRKDGDIFMVNLITTPVQIPSDIKGNISPNLTILLTGTPPEGRTNSIWTSYEIKSSFDWKNYGIMSWTHKVSNIRDELQDVAVRADHKIRINVCRGVPQKHIDRLTGMMKEYGLTNYEFVYQ